MSLFIVEFYIVCDMHVTLLHTYAMHVTLIHTYDMHVTLIHTYDMHVTLIHACYINAYI